MGENMLSEKLIFIILSFFSILLILIRKIQTEKELKISLTFSVINFLLTIITFFFHDKIIAKDNFKIIYNRYLIFVILYFVFNFILLSKSVILKSNHYKLFIKSIKSSKWNIYYVVDKKEKIKDISFGLLQEMDMRKEDVLGKKIFWAFNKKIRFINLNGSEINNKSAENYYNNYRKNAKIGDEFIEEIIILNSKGKQVIFKLMMQPVFVMGKYKGRVVIGEKKDDFDLLNVEKKLNNTNTALNSIKEKFIATLEISKEGLFYIDLDQKTIWASDALVKILNLKENLIEIDEFRRRFHPDDLIIYFDKLKNLTLSNPTYYIKYRLVRDSSYIWVEERGKRIFDDLTTNTIMGSLNPIDAKYFRNSNIKILDDLKTFNEMLVKLKTLINSDNYFYLMIIDLNNIPKINEKFSWEVGNMLIGEYINKMFNSFVSQNGDIYRLSGITFAILITDSRKMSFLKKGIKDNKTFLNLKIQYGAIEEELEVFAGISTKDDSVSEENIYKNAKKALNFAKEKDFSNNGVFYEDVKKYE